MLKEFVQYNHIKNVGLALLSNINQKVYVIPSRHLNSSPLHFTTPQWQKKQQTTYPFSGDIPI